MVKVGPFMRQELRDYITKNILPKRFPYPVKVRFTFGVKPYHTCQFMARILVTISAIRNASLQSTISRLTGNAAFY